MGDDLSITRRAALKIIAAASATAASGCADPPSSQEAQAMLSSPVGGDAVLKISPLAFPWETSDPFLFCVHHDDHYPAGNAHMGPDPALLAGRAMGQDFVVKDGFRMYHGQVVPGFPQHPHRGFETVTVVRHGRLDHSDSLGAAARYGGGDVQWLTAGKGILHAEMFPLLKADAPNPLELFQIWLNLPARNKMVEPHFTMLWAEAIPTAHFTDDKGRATEVTVVAGRYGDNAPPSPPPNSWASQADSDVAIWTIKMAPGAQWTLPEAQAGTVRSLYFFLGSGLKIGGKNIPDYHRTQLRGDAKVSLEAGASGAELLLLQGRPIGEPVAQHGPFVMNTPDEIRQAYADYRRTRFGGWNWQRNDPVHPRDKDRFARHADGREESPT